MSFALSTSLKRTIALKGQAPLLLSLNQQHRMHSAQQPTHHQQAFTPDRKHGSVHWKLERVTAISMVPLVTATFIMGPNTLADVLLGVLLPFHVHMGFDACITDYFNPSRANPLLCKAMTYTLHTSSTAVMLGCALFNYRDVGITEFIQRIWAA